MPRDTYAETGSYEIWSQVSLLSTKKYHKMFNETLDLQDDDNFHETESSIVTYIWTILCYTVYNWIIYGRTSQL